MAEEPRPSRVADRRAHLSGGRGRAAGQFDPVPADGLDGAARAASAAQHRHGAGRSADPRASSRAGARPTISGSCRRCSIGLSREHAWAPGTLSLSVSGMTAHLRDLGREIARALPARNLLIVNGHGGNRGILEARRARDCAATSASTSARCTLGALMSPRGRRGVPEIHAGKDETSVMLVLAPESGAARARSRSSKASRTARRSAR